MMSDDDVICFDVKQEVLLPHYSLLFRKAHACDADLLKKKRFRKKKKDIIYFLFEIIVSGESRVSRFKQARPCRAMPIGISRRRLKIQSVGTQRTVRIIFYATNLLLLL
jgi:hypothetical protein